MPYGAEILTAEQLGSARQRTGDLTDPACYPRRADVDEECDLVMKGGITSGVVYPFAACELARRYRFVNVGGSSAGAIAAAMVAAAEHGRDHRGFVTLAGLPDKLGSRLPQLFEPGPHTATAHAVLMALVEKTPGSHNGHSKKVLRNAAPVLLRAQRARFVKTATAVMAAAALPALAAVGLPRSAGDAVRLGVLAPLPIVVGLGAAALRVLWAEAQSTWAGLSQQGFGICVGSAGDKASASASADDSGYFTDWLGHHIDDIAGVERPLTFGDLEDAGVHLRVMTTNLTQGRPTSIPFEEEIWMFDPDELGAYFPATVTKQLVAAGAPAVRDGQPLCSPEGRPLHHLPSTRALPVIVAVRLSLSFPGLISAVPLYAIDHSRKLERDQQPVRCWFSDGGIASNFPIHFFDALWPRRATFGLDLRPYHQDYPDDDVYYGGTKHRKPSVKRIDNPAAFGAAILDTMQYWSDNAQVTMPGFRDRVAEVHLHDHEGGMNLRMSADVITVVAEKGRQVAEELMGRFDFEGHRWTRYRTVMAELQKTVHGMESRYTGSLPGGHTGYRDLIRRAPSLTPDPKPPAWAKDAEGRTDQLLAFAHPVPPDFEDDAPLPLGVLRVTPNF